eukprot:11179521-Lingulodinium_polyedra.AAC.1
MAARTRAGPCGAWPPSLPTPVGTAEKRRARSRGRRAAGGIRGNPSPSGGPNKTTTRSPRKARNTCVGTA